MSSLTESNRNCLLECYSTNQKLSDIIAYAMNIFICVKAPVLGVMLFALELYMIEIANMAIDKLLSDSNEEIVEGNSTLDVFDIIKPLKTILIVICTLLLI